MSSFQGLKNKIVIAGLASASFFRLSYVHSLISNENALQFELYAPPDIAKLVVVDALGHKTGQEDSLTAAGQEIPHSVFGIKEETSVTPKYSFIKISPPEPGNFRARISASANTRCEFCVSSANHGSLGTNCSPRFYVGPSATQEYLVSWGNGVKSVTKLVDPATLRAEFILARMVGDITDDEILKRFLNEVDAAVPQEGNEKKAGTLTALNQDLKSEVGKHINSESAAIIGDDIQALIQRL